MMPPQSTHYHGSVGAILEGWMKSSSSSSSSSPSSVLLLTMTNNLFAMAKARSAMIMSLSNAQSNDSSKTPSSIAICLSRWEETHVVISAIQWIHWRDISFLAVATSLGSVLFYSAKGFLLFRQPFICRSFYSVEEESNKRRFSLTNLAYFSSQKLPYQVWNVAKNTRGTSMCVDGVICGTMVPGLFESCKLDQQHYCAITLARDCVFAVHRLVEDKGANTIMSVILKKIVPTTLSTFTMLARFFWQDCSEENQSLDVMMQESEKSSLVSVFTDGMRKGERISVSHWGSLAALTDSLGRVLLIETRTYIVVRLWKGYRDAFCCFLDVPTKDNKYATVGSASHVATSPRNENIALCLVIHAPRQGVVEVWKLRDGPRLCVIRCGWNSQVIQPALPLQDCKSKAPQEVYILDGFSGNVVSIKPCIRQ